MTALVIGAGPAGLMAAEELAKAGHSVVVADAKPSVGRKFLMAGRSGLNLTKAEEFEPFLHHYGASAEKLREALSEFDPNAVQNWAMGLGQEVFTGSSGRVFPVAMKASPLLRVWIARLRGNGVEMRTNWRWTGNVDRKFIFDTPKRQADINSDVTVLALGGASWSRLGSDGQWAELLRHQGVAIEPFAPANAGLAVNWSSHMERFFGLPVKGVALVAGETRSRGEFVVSSRGLEGGGVYSMSSAIRQGGNLMVDLLPDWTLERVAEKLSRPRGKATIANHLRKSLGLDPVKIGLLMEFGRPLPAGAALAQLVKALPIRYVGFRPMDEAISTAGGVSWDAVDNNFMLREMPGVFVAGEMLDWEAPTGGYLLTACLATGKWAGRHAAVWR